jgi:hypothetical protein
MGTFTSLTVDGYEIVSTKSWADPTVMTIFSESDRYCRLVRMDSEENRHVVADKVKYDRGLDSDEEEIEVGYNAPGWVIRDRLEANGFTINTCRAVFVGSIKSRIEELEELGKEDREVYDLYSEEIALLKELSFDKWLEEFSVLKREGTHSWHLHKWSENHTPRVVSRIAKYMLTEEGAGAGIFGFLCPDIRYFVRAVVHACGEDAVFEQDLSGVISAGWYERDEAVVESARASLISDFPSNAKIIILTEGITDRRAIEGSLRLIYPHLLDLYSFMDFDGPGAKGGADQLVHTLKAFIGAGIANRVIAVFDNDTGALSALRGLRQEMLPASMRVLNYPLLEIARNYPTLGPSGLVNMDVNGLAGSLEMYFGEDILKQDDGSLTPVQWKGYDSGLRQYQGELLNKSQLQSDFFAKLEQALTNSSVFQTQDWNAMRLILDSIRSAFAE